MATTTTGARTTSGPFFLSFYIYLHCTNKYFQIGTSSTHRPLPALSPTVRPTTTATYEGKDNEGRNPNGVNRRWTICMFFFAFFATYNKLYSNRHVKDTSTTAYHHLRGSKRRYCKHRRLDPRARDASTSRAPTIYIYVYLQI